MKKGAVAYARGPRMKVAREAYGKFKRVSRIRENTCWRNRTTGAARLQSREGKRETWERVRKHNPEKVT